MGTGMRKLPRELERANRLGAAWAVIAGDDELARGEAHRCARCAPASSARCPWTTLADELLRLCGLPAGAEVHLSAMHPYRTHTCGELRPSHVGETARLAGWVHRKRDHGNLVFVDLRDHYGLTQCVIDAASPVFAEADALRPETVITVDGRGRASRGRCREPPPRHRRDRARRA